MKKELIHVKNLNYYYIDNNNAKKHILKNINISLFENESLCILGQTGCGKTTLIKTIAGIIPDNANYSYDELINNSVKMGFVLQDPNTALNPTLKIKTQFKLFLKNKNKNISNAECLQKIKDLLNEVNISNIDNVIDKYPLELSKGMNQRITISMALINEPELLILDEPTSAIDSSNRNQLLELLLKLKEKRNLGLIYVTHDVKLAEKIADRIIIMHDGKVIETINRINGIFDYKSNYSKRLKENANILNADKEIKKNEKILEIDNINKKFGNNIVLNNLSFNLYKGETLGIIGPSGSGKSTLCKILMGIYDKDSGVIKNYYNMRIDMVNQDAKLSLDPYVRVLDILNEKNYIMKKKPFSEKEILSIFKSFNLPKYLLYKYPNELSGGQKQLILIIRSILYNYEIIILDEPTSSLDVLTQKLVLDKLQMIKDKFNLTYIFISHDQDVIEYMCDRVVHINKGL